jgi:hypothetical protein
MLYWFSDDKVRKNSYENYTLYYYDVKILDTIFVSKQRFGNKMTSVAHRRKVLPCYESSVKLISKICI